MSLRFASFSMPISIKYGTVFLNIWWMPLRIAPFWGSQGFNKIKRIKKIKKTPHLPGRWLGVWGCGGVRVCPSLPALGKEGNRFHSHPQTQSKAFWCNLKHSVAFSSISDALWSLLMHCEEGKGTSPQHHSPARPSSASEGGVFLIFVNSFNLFKALCSSKWSDS